MKISAAGLLIGLSLVAPQWAGAQPERLRELIGQRHRQQLSSLPLARGRTISTNILFGDLDRDGLDDAFVAWCIDATDEDRGAGGGNALMLMSCVKDGFAVYLRSGKMFRLAADVSRDDFAESGYLPLSADSIHAGRVYCSAYGYTDDDPRCCPSLNGSIYLRWEGNKLVKPPQAVIIK